MLSNTDWEIITRGQTEAIDIYVKDPRTQELTDVANESLFYLIDIMGSDDTVLTLTFGPSGSPEIQHLSTGTYRYNFDSSVYTREYIADFKCSLESQSIHTRFFVKSASARCYKYAAHLRAQVDKARKTVSDEVENMDRVGPNQPSMQFFFGYDDKHLILYLERGLQFINAIPPFTALTLDTFPFRQYGGVLIDAGTIAALEAQGIFAIDTDFSYAYGGNSFVIEHFGKLNTALSTLTARFDTMLVKFKAQYRSKGLVMFQFMPGGVRAQRQLNAMPSGWWSRMLSTAYQ